MNDIIPRIMPLIAQPELLAREFGKILFEHLVDDKHCSKAIALVLNTTIEALPPDARKRFYTEAQKQCLTEFLPPESKFIGKSATV